MKNSFLFRKVKDEDKVVQRYVHKVYNPSITKPKYRRELSEKDQERLDSYLREVYNPK